MANFSELFDKVVGFEKTEQSTQFVNLKSSPLITSKKIKYVSLDVKLTPQSFNTELHALIKSHRGWWDGAQRLWHINLYFDPKEQSEVDKNQKFIKSLLEMCDKINSSESDLISGIKNKEEVFLPILNKDGFDYSDDEIKVTYNKEIQKIIVSCGYSNYAMRDVIRNADPLAKYSKVLNGWSCSPGVYDVFSELINKKKNAIANFAHEQENHIKNIDINSVTYDKKNILGLSIKPRFDIGYFEVCSTISFIKRGWLYNELCNKIILTTLTQDCEYILATEKKSFKTGTKNPRLYIPFKNHASVADMISKIETFIATLSNKVLKVKMPNSGFSLVSQLRSYPNNAVINYNETPYVCLQTSYRYEKSNSSSSGFGGVGYDHLSLVAFAKSNALEEYFSNTLVDLVDIVRAKITEDNTSRYYYDDLTHKISTFLMLPFDKFADNPNLYLGEFVSVIERLILKKECNTDLNKSHINKKFKI